ncbi:SH3 domain-containing protein [Sagittula sp. NFXS13]|uniref:SH3 domain-containing protein n=1 Tax=Sagittula sp. NFXS13 TaxID=2819095 RepID=UPI0032DF57DB
MRKVTATALGLAMMAAVLSSPADAAWRDLAEVSGVDADDMLKMRAGPGTGFLVIVGLPNGTLVRVHNCQRTGATRWCDVALDQAPGLRGFVSDAYLTHK